MVKDSSSAIVTKRRSKTALENDDNDIYKRVIGVEEKHAKQRDTNTDAQIYMMHCDQLMQQLADIFKMKMEAKEDRDAVLVKRSQACCTTAVLKKLNRMDKVRMMSAREATNIEKDKLESVALQAQNHVYEIEHIMEELNICRKYKTNEDRIELVSMEDFMESLSAPLLPADHPHYSHQIHLGRLEYELSERIKLAKLLEELQQRRVSLKQEIVSKKMKLKEIKLQLAVVVDSTKQLQAHFGLNVAETREKNKLACHLSDQLFLLFSNADGYRQFANGGIAVKINGSLNDLPQFNEAMRQISNEIEDESDGDADTADASVEEPFNKHRQRKNSKADKVLEKRRRLLLQHPLSLTISLKINKSKARIQMKFVYLPNLGIVTVESKVITNVSALQSGCALNVMTGESILNELFEGDTGLELANKANHYQLKQVGIHSYASIVSELGYAYNWAQRMCGMEFLTTANYQKRLNCLLPLNIDEIFMKIEKRLTTRTQLASQLRHLGENVIPAVPEHVGIPNTASTTLTEFISSTYNDFCMQIASAAELKDAEVVSATDMFYMATFSRSNMDFMVFIVIKNDYPVEAPIFFISVQKASDEIRMESRNIEREVNLRWKTTNAGIDHGNWLLSAQMRYLCSLFDVLLETQPNPQTCPRTTTFFYPIRARNRRHPYSYRNVGNGYFSQF